MRDVLLRPENIYVQIVADLYALKNAKKPFMGTAFLPAQPAGTERKIGAPRDLKAACVFLGNAITHPSKDATVLSLASIESSFCLAASAGIYGFGHPDSAPMLVAVELLCSIEGPMWRLIRGQGLAYGFSLYGAAEEGLVYFSLMRASNLPKAFAEARRLVGSFADGTTLIDPIALENAVASVVSSVVSREQTVASCGMQAMMSALRDAPPGYNQRVLGNVQAVTSEDVLRVLRQYLIQVFDPAFATLAITTNVNKLPEVVSGFKEAGWDVTQVDSIESQVA
ncbi:Metalloenzyme, LuxS/M16 peptidase-like protein [Baffinella frigidus]|nr:Metalloenzyme, LuxS/M16 peptidase-like protein [Cryptophyta sp. CCMP2293]